MTGAKMYRLAIRAIAPFFLLLGLCATVAAQEWPAKTVRIVVPFGPGSTPDIVARLVADGLQQRYPGSAFLVENKPAQVAISAPIWSPRLPQTGRRSA